MRTRGVRRLGQPADERDAAGGQHHPAYAGRDAAGGPAGAAAPRSASTTTAVVAAHIQSAHAEEGERRELGQGHVERGAGGARPG